jgi:MerR family transcriptional regulator, light-induced transcriptional regulator
MGRRFMRAFLEAILAGDLRAATARARDAFARDGVPFLYEQVVEPALCALGDLWQEERITVADEHLASAVAQAAIAALYPEFPWPVGGPKAIVACVAGENHQMGARMAADLLALDGWDVDFLGADVPAAALASRAGHVQAAMVGLSVTLTSHLSAARAAVVELRRSGSAAKVIAGGRALAGVTASDLGVDAVAPPGIRGVDLVRAFRP